MQITLLQERQAGNRASCLYIYLMGIEHHIITVTQSKKSWRKFAILLPRILPGEYNE
jgi:hypothetical protein